MGYRQKVEKSIGRKLTDNEIVHHINIIHEDNRIENLQVMTRKEHAIYHHKGKVIKQKSNPNKLKGFKIHDIVRITNLKSKNYNKLVEILTLHEFGLKATVTSIYGHANTIDNCVGINFSLKSLCHL